MELSIEEQQYYDQLMGRKSEKAALDDYTKPLEDETTIEDYGRRMGADVNKLQKEASEEIQTEESMEIGATGRPMAAEGDLGGAAKGAAQGIVDVAQNVLNVGIEIADGIENFAASYGVGKGDIISDGDRIDWSNKLGSPDDSLTVRAARQITKYAAPVVATMGAGGTVMGGLAVGSAVDFLTLDPNQTRLSTILRDELPELKNYPTAYAIVDSLSNKPDDSALMGRAKNVLEGLGIVAPLAGTFAAIAKGFSKLGAAGQKIEDAVKMGAKNEDILATVKPMPEAELAAIEAKISPVPDKPIYNFKPVVENNFNLNNNDVVEFAAQFSRGNPKEVGDLFRGAKSGEELSQEVSSLLRDEEKLKNLLSWRLGDRPLSDVEVKASQYLMSNTYKSVTDAATKAVSSGADEDLLHVSQMLDTFKYINDTRIGAGSEAGRALRAHELAADIYNTPVEEFTKALTDQKRQELLVKAIKAHGGKENLMEMAKRIKVISEMPDIDVNNALKEAISVSGFEKISGVLQSIAINGMLSSPKTVVSNTISNAINMSNTIMENYLAAGVGTVRGTQDAIRLSDANSYVRGLMGGFFEGVSAAGQALRTGAGGPANTIKGDLVKPLNAITAAELGIPIEHGFGYKILGKIVDGTGLAVGLPTRINATSDAFFGTILYRAKQYERASMEVRKLGLKGQEAADYITNRVKKVTIADDIANKAFAQENTFSKALSPNSLAEKVDNVIEKFPAGRVIMPFFKTSANIIEYSYKHSPLALFSGPIREQIIKGGKEADLAVAKIILGSSFLGTAAYLASEGVITGPEPRNFKLKQAVEESGLGWQPDSILINGHYIGYNRIDPMNSFLRLGAVLSSLRNYVKEDEYDELVALSGGAVIDFMTPEMMIDGYSKLFEAYNEASRYQTKDKILGVSVDIASRFVPYSALQRDFKNIKDPYRGSTAIATEDVNWLNKFTDKLMVRYKSISPWFSEDLPVQRNIFGHALRVPDGLGPDMISPFTVTKKGGSDVAKKIAELAGFREQFTPGNDDFLPLEVSLPSRVFSHEGVTLELTPQEYERYVLYAAGRDEDGKSKAGDLESVLDKQLKSLKNIGPDMSPIEYNKYIGTISKTITDYRNMAKKRMLAEPEFMDRYLKAVDAGLQKQTIDPF